MLRLTPTPSPKAVRPRPPRRLLSHPATSLPLPQPGRVTQCAWFPADTGISCVRGFPNYCLFSLLVFSVVPARIYLPENFGPRAYTFFFLSFLLRVQRYNVYLFCVLPLTSRYDTPGWAVLLTNVQSAHAVKTPRFRDARPFFSIFPEAFGIIFFPPSAPPRSFHSSLPR